MGDNHTNRTCRVVDPDTLDCGGEEFYRQEFLKDTQVIFWAYLGAYIALVLFAGEREGPRHIDSLVPRLVEREAELENSPFVQLLPSCGGVSVQTLLCVIDFPEYTETSSPHKTLDHCKLAGCEHTVLGSILVIIKTGVRKF